LRPQAQIKFRSFFQPASVEFVRFGAQIMRAAGCIFLEKDPQAFFDSL
jgi:hypothetical protein